MIGDSFQSRIFGSKDVRVNTQGRKEIKLIYESDEDVQMFLQSWDEQFHTDMRYYFKPDTINWDRIEFKELFPHLTISIDSESVVLEKCEVNKIVVKRKETHDSEKFIYELTIIKPLQSEIDNLISEVYNKNKEPNPENDDKMEFVLYETLIERAV